MGLTERIKNALGNNKLTYYIIIALIGIILAPFFLRIISENPKFNGPHYYEYYTSSILMAEAIKSLDFKSLIYLYAGSYCDKMIFLLRIPVMLIFGYSPTLFVFTNYIVNIILLLFLYNAMLKFERTKEENILNIEEPEKTALFFILFIMASYFFLELQLSFYIDLTYFLLCALFLIYLCLFNNDCTKNNITLAIIIFLMMMAKNTSYILFPIFFAMSAIHFLITKKEKKWQYLKRLAIIFTAGTALYLLIATGFSPGLINMELSRGYTMSGSPDLIYYEGMMPKIIHFAYAIIKRGIEINDYAFKKFSSAWLSVLVYIAATYYAIKGKNRFILYLFICSEIFLLFFFNIKGHRYELRLLTPMYFIYFYMFYFLGTDILRKIFKKNLWTAAAVLIILLGVINMSFLIKNSFSGEFKTYYLRYAVGAVELVPENIKFNSVVYIPYDANLIQDYFADLIDYVMEEKIAKDSAVYQRMASLCKFEKRFCYKVIGRSEYKENKDKIDYAMEYHPENLPFNYSVLNSAESVIEETAYFVEVIKQP
ncbi:MAG: hypothetical protein NTV63_03755 [Candidatus Woesearchaeota archaeon]|nr:hypothetical protein [Candidatus Woesearchaeota archaeon]